MMGYAGYVFLKTVIEDCTGLLYGWVGLKIVEIFFLSFVICYPFVRGC